MKELFWEDIKNASNRLSPFIRMTPLIESGSLSDLHGKAVFLKSEHLQLTGAFKVRGAMNCMMMKSKSSLESGVICASAGNHAQGVAYAAKMLGIKSTIVMPKITPTVKVTSTELLGAEVLIHGNNFDEANEKAKELIQASGACHVHPFDDHDVIAGQGSIGFELLAQLPQMATVLVPVGGGGLLAGILMAIKIKRPDVKVYGVEPSGASGMHDSLRAGKLVELSNIYTLAEGVAVLKVGQKPFNIISKLVDGILLVDENEIKDAVHHLMMNEKMVVEFAGALSVAALKQISHLSGPVISLITGGNIDSHRITRTLSEHINRGI